MAKKKDLITVIIPTYNSERTIERALKSVFSQKVNVEVLICDDCSTDKTIDICKNYPVKIIINDYHTGGPNKGRNNGIKNATGNLIAFLDHDDEWLPNKLKSQLKEIRNGADFVYSQCIKKLE